MPDIKAKCLICGKVFTSNRSNAKYCSPNCRKKAKALSQRSHHWKEYVDSCQNIVSNVSDTKTPVKKQGYYSGTRFTTRGNSKGWRCKDCGKLSQFYRCPECREKFLRKHGYNPNINAYEYD